MLIKIVVLVLGVWLFSMTPQAQTSDPSTLPRIESAAALEYVGGFRVPTDVSNGDHYSYGGKILAYNPAKNSLFLSTMMNTVGEISIPTPVNSANPNALPVSTLLQPIIDPSEGNMGPMSNLGPSNLYGLHVTGTRLNVTFSVYYDAMNTQQVTHFSRSTNLATPSFSGWSQVWEDRKAGFVSGGMADIPVAWQAKLGGTTLTGQCCVPITSRTSQGPSAFVFDPTKLGQAKVPAFPLLYYPLDNATLGPWSGSNPTFGATMEARGMVVIPGTRTVLYLGRNGVGPYCYGTATDKPELHDKTVDGEHYCYDPTAPGKAQHSYPYTYQMWAYDLNDFAAVKAGTKQPWEVVPYGVWPFSLPTLHEFYPIGGITYDAQRQVIYLSQPGADPNGNLASAPVIHAFKVNLTVK